MNGRTGAESAPRIFRSLKVRAEKVRHFPFWECARVHARIPNSRNTDARAEHNQAPISFLGMREIKILGTQKVRGANLIRLLTVCPSGKVRTEKVRRFPFWECAHARETRALSNSWNIENSTGLPRTIKIRGTQKARASLMTHIYDSRFFGTQG
jgi:hypothetical protein